MDALWNDLRYAIRTFQRERTFTFVAVTTIACGIGATTAIFSLVNAVLLRPLPYPDADRLVMLLNTRRGQVAPSPYVSAPRIRAWRAHSVSVREVAGYLLGPVVNLTGVGQPQQVPAGRVTASFFHLFGARLAQGRTFTVDEDRPDGPNVAILSYGLWQRQWGADRRIVGQNMSINGDLFTVVGVLDARFDPRSLSPAVVAPPDIWLPLRLDPDTLDDANNLLAAARLGPSIHRHCTTTGRTGSRCVSGHVPGRIAAGRELWRCPSQAGLTSFLTTLLFGVTAHDPATFTIVPVTFVVAALGGVCVPARRAAGVDPLVALRSE
jgi:hypothetical protein